MSIKKQNLDYPVTGVLRFGFPQGKVSCHYCPAKRVDGTGRCFCWMTGETIENPKSEIGDKCNLEFVLINKEEKK